MNDEPNRPDDSPEHDQDEPSSGKDHGDSAPAPFAPHKDDDSAFGDTDQHSDA